MNLREYERGIIDYVNDHNVVDEKVKPVVEEMLESNLSSYNMGLSTRTMYKKAHFEAKMRKIAGEVEQEVASSLNVTDRQVREAGRKELAKALIRYYQKASSEQRYFLTTAYANK